MSNIPGVYRWVRRDAAEGEEPEEMLEWDGTNLCAVAAFDGAGLQPNWSPEFGLQVWDGETSGWVPCPPGHHIARHPAGYRVVAPEQLVQTHTRAD